MPALTTYRLFISHSWAHGDAYDKLVSFFDEHPNFKWANYSVPKDDPIHDAPNQTKLYEAIKNQISPPTINIFNQDPACDLDYCANVARDMKIDVALSNSFGFGGTNGTLVFKRFS